MRLLPAVCLILSFACGFAESTAIRVAIPAGAYKPLFGSNGEKLDVNAFWLDRTSVSDSEFRNFTMKNKGWRKGAPTKSLVDKNYLSRPATPGAPITYISWFAASAFCEVKGGRLPTTLEWEYVAAASSEQRDATNDPKFQEKVLLWYTTRTPDAKPINQREANFYGVSGLHGSIWEWTSDFNAFFVTADNRQDGDQSKNFFCGGASTGASNRDGYPAFMRYALRSSLQANYSLNNLGFRCAYDTAK